MFEIFCKIFFCRILNHGVFWNGRDITNGILFFFNNFKIVIDLIGSDAKGFSKYSFFFNLSLIIFLTILSCSKGGLAITILSELYNISFSSLKYLIFFHIFLYLF